MFIAIYCFANCLSNRFVRSYSISLSYSVRCAEDPKGMRLDTLPRLLHYYLGRVVRYGQVNGHYKEARSSINRMPWLSAHLLLLANHVREFSAVATETKLPEKENILDRSGRRLMSTRPWLTSSAPTGCLVKLYCHGWCECFNSAAPWKTNQICV